MDAVRFEGVRKRYGGHVAVDGVDLALASGSLVGLIGPNGAGKSTLMRSLMGLLRPTEGKVLVHGVDVFEHPREARSLVGSVPEEPPLYEWLSAREFLEFVAAVRGVSDVGSALELADLGKDADRLIREYSQGMRRRTALAAASLGEPKVLVLDEALNGLDPPSAQRVRVWLRARVEAGTTVLLSTHVVDTVERLADRVVMLVRGKVVADERREDLGSGGLEKLFLEKMA